MQFIKNGPDVPEPLLQAHEERRVVFFCGAGISYPAGLPGFGGLVDKLYAALGTRRDPIEDETYRREHYDATLDLLERRFPGRRLAVRTELLKVLQPKLRRKGATDTHAALLQLARGRDNAVRLVTTNFDRIFQRLIARDRLAIPEYPAPLLPIPKNSRWNGIVYLHGLLPKTADESALNRLVLTSGDFGLAYLTERWAARFVGELFRNYVVCFVGYSINDPVLRYMMDALAADRILGELTPQAYAFGECPTGQEAQKKIEWEARGVTPILYEVPTGTVDHSSLHRTLKEWADTYRDGVRGKERIVVEHAMARPLASTRQDDFVGRMLWALADPSGMPAKRFAEFDPAPSLDWLDALCDERYGHADLGRFGVQSQQAPDDKLAFSLTRRPAPHTHAPRMSVVDEGATGSQWDPVMSYLARWLTRHLDDPALVWWLAERGGQLHGQFAGLLDHRLDELSRIEREGTEDELQRLRASSPNAIPRPLMGTVWRLLLSGRAKSSWRHVDLYRWQERLNRDGLTPSLRLKLRDILAPRVSLRQPFRWDEDAEDNREATQLKELVDWEIVLSADHVHSSLSHLAQSSAWQAGLPQLLDDVEGLLRDALDLMRELGGADDRDDRSHWDLPSISPHPQNQGFHDWVSLIEILRDAWLATLERNPTRARRVVEDWWEQPYPTFKRLALFAARLDGVAADGMWVDWLLVDDGWWLWSEETKRETMRLLVLCGASLSTDDRARLEAGILSGPPRRMYGGDMEYAYWVDLVDKEVWLRLAKLVLGGTKLDGNAERRLGTLTSAHSHWQLATNERDEFPLWMSGSDDPDDQEWRQFEKVPHEPRKMMIWLQKPPSTDPWHENDWREVCRERFRPAAWALCKLAREDQWPAERWREALQTWSNDPLQHRSWRYLAPVLQRMPDATLLAIAHSAACWLMKAAAEVLDRHEAVFLELCRRLLAMDHRDEIATKHPMTQAIDLPVGDITRALLQHCFHRQPDDGQGLPDYLKPLFTRLCDSRLDKYCQARVVLATYVITLFRVDPDWAREHLLPLFNWESLPVEARAAWEGFLWSPRPYRPLLAAFKNDFLATARHYDELGEHARQYAAILTFAALDPADTFTTDELHDATLALPPTGLQEAAQALVRSLEGTSEQRESHWTNRIGPYWHKIWPKSRQLASKAIAEQLARLAIAAGDALPAAVTSLRDWLQPFEFPHYVIHRLHASGLCARHPRETLTLLGAIIADQPWPGPELRLCLDAIAEAWLDAPRDHHYQRLIEYLRQREP